MNMRSNNFNIEPKKSVPYHELINVIKKALENYHKNKAWFSDVFFKPKLLKTLTELAKSEWLDDKQSYQLIEAIFTFTDDRLTDLMTEIKQAIPYEILYPLYHSKMLDSKRTFRILTHPDLETLKVILPELMSLQLRVFSSLTQGNSYKMLDTVDLIIRHDDSNGSPSLVPTILKMYFQNRLREPEFSVVKQIVRASSAVLAMLKTMDEAEDQAILLKIVDWEHLLIVLRELNSLNLLNVKNVRKFKSAADLSYFLNLLPDVDILKQKNLQGSQQYYFDLIMQDTNKERVNRLRRFTNDMITEQNILQFFLLTQPQYKVFNLIFEDMWFDQNVYNVFLKVKNTLGEMHGEISAKRAITSQLAKLILQSCERYANDPETLKDAINYILLTHQAPDYTRWKQQRSNSYSSTYNQNKSTHFVEQEDKRASHEILGVAYGAKEADIKKAYKKLALTYHPDRNRGKSAAEAKKAEEEFKKVGNAYEAMMERFKPKDKDFRI